jgi:hypothetical protein
MKQTMLAIVIVLAGCSQAQAPAGRIPWPNTPSHVQPTGSAGAVGGIRDGIEALTKLNEEIDAARRNGGKITVDVNLPSCSGKECSTCQSCVPEFPQSTITDCASGSPECQTECTNSSQQNGTPKVYRRGLFGRRVYTNY